MRVLPLSGTSILLIRGATGLLIKETKEVYKGEVTESTPAEAENPLSGYGKTVRVARHRREVQDSQVHEAIAYRPDHL